MQVFPVIHSYTMPRWFLPYICWIKDKRIIAKKLTWKQTDEILELKMKVALTPDYIVLPITSV